MTREIYLTLEKALDICGAAESLNKQMITLTGAVKDISLNAVKSKKGIRPETQGERKIKMLEVWNKTRKKLFVQSLVTLVMNVVGKITLQRNEEVRKKKTKKRKAVESKCRVH